MPLIKKFLDQEGLTIFSRQLNNYPDNTVLSAVIDGMQDALDEKMNSADGVTNVSYNAQDKKLQQVLNGITRDVVTVATIKTDLALTKSDVGLGSVDNTSDLNKPISTATQTALNAKLNTALKGANSGLAELDGGGKVPNAQLPSSVFNVHIYNGVIDFPTPGQADTLYVDSSTDRIYRWSGAQYVVISSTLQLGTTSSDAYRGDHGYAAYTHGVTNKGNAFTSGLYKITTNAEGHVTAATAVVKADITNLGIPAQDTTYELDGTYNSVTNKVATLSSITNALSALGSTITGGAGASKTLTSLVQTNGNVSATFGDIAITASQVTDAGDAAVKDVDIQMEVDTTVSNYNSFDVTSTNLPTSQAVAGYIESLVGTAGGVAALDSNGKVPSSQLPSYVDDVEEYLSIASFPNIGEADKIYVDNDTGITYRWSGSNYIEISSSLALGTTEHTAYRGDRGSMAYTHAVTNKGTGYNAGFYKIGTNDEGHVNSATAVTASDITGLGVAAVNIIKIGPLTFTNEESSAATITTTVNSSSATFPITAAHEIIKTFYSDMKVFSGNVSVSTSAGSATINVPLKAGKSVDATIYIGIPQ